MKLRSLWRTKMFNRVRLIRCKSQKSLEKMEEKLIRMNKRVAILDKNLIDITNSKNVADSNQISKFLGVDISRIDVLLVLDEES